MFGIARAANLMKSLICVTALVLGGAFVSGCATVNVGAVAGGAASSLNDASHSAPQRELRTVSTAFVDQAEDAGWSDSHQMNRAARRAIDTLLHGRSDVSAEVQPNRSAAFMDRHGFLNLSPDEAADMLSAEIRQARLGVRAVNAAAGAVATGPVRASWSRRDDVRAVESVVRAAHQAFAMLNRISADAEPGMSETARLQVRRELSAFGLELDRLSEAADAVSAPYSNAPHADDTQSGSVVG